MAYLKPKFPTPADASAHYFTQPLHPNSGQSATLDEQLCGLSAAFSSVCHSLFSVDVPEDFLVLSARAMNRLHQVKRSNVLYNIAKGLGNMRPDGSDSVFPSTRMPMGLLEYMAGFFTAEEMRKVRIQHNITYVWCCSAIYSV